jgi:hypothetical protein
MSCLMICSIGPPSLDQKEEVEKFLLAVVARFKAFKKRVPSNSFVDKRPQCASASKAKSSGLPDLWGLEHVLFNDFIDDELDRVRRRVRAEGLYLCARLCSNRV